MARIFRAGNSMVVSLPREIMKSLGLGEGSSVSVRLDPQNRRIIVTPEREDLQGVNEEFARQVKEFIDEYRPALEALARR